jgi:GxxExxY protein
LLPISYDDVAIDTRYRIDIFVEKCIIVELKAVEKMVPLFEAQLLTYMKLSQVRLGYLISFSVSRLKYGIKRMDL